MNIDQDQDALGQIEGNGEAIAAKQAADRLVCEMWVVHEESGRYQPVFARIEDRGGELRVIYRKAFREGVVIKPANSASITTKLPVRFVTLDTNSAISRKTDGGRGCPSEQRRVR